MAILTTPTFYIDHINGNNDVRPTLTNAVASNPSGSIVRITFANHGLVTGACVTLSGFTSYLNGYFKITVFDVNSFDLDDTNWATTSDPTGNVVPHGGSSWADAWKTPAAATLARLTTTPGIIPIIKVRKTEDPKSIGDLLWTIGDNSYIDLPVGETVDICMCETAWTANPTGDTTVTLTPVATDAKQGSYSVRFLTDSATQLNILQAYFQIATLDLSAYQQISFWIKTGQAFVTDLFKIALCSDTAGTIIVDEFLFPAISTQWMPLTISRTGGGNLGSAIQSIAIYTTGNAAHSKYFFLDNIIATKANRTSLTSIISNSPHAQTSVDNFIIQSIENNVLRLGSWLSNKANVNIPVCAYIETGIYSTYIREGIRENLSTLGSANWQGGYDVLTDTQNGQTIYEGNGTNTVITLNKANLTINWFGTVRALDGFSLAIDKINIENIGIIAGSQGRCFRMTKTKCYIDKIYSMSNQAYEIGGINNTINIIYNSSDTSIIINATSTLINYIHRAGNFSISGGFNKIIKIDNLLDYNTGLGRFYNSINSSVEFLGNAISNAGIRFQTAYNCYVHCGGEWRTHSNNITDSLVIASALSFGCYVSNYKRPLGQNGIIEISDYTDSYMSLLNNEEIEHNNYIFGYDAVANYQTDVKHGTDPGAWKVEILGIKNPVRTWSFRIKLAEIGFIKDIPVVFKVWVKKSPYFTTYPITSLTIPANIAIGVNQTLNVFSADNEDWQQLTVSFTPIIDGAADVFYEQTLRGVCYFGSILTYQAI